MIIFLWIVVAILFNSYLLSEFPSIYPIVFGNIALVLPILSDKLRDFMNKKLGKLFSLLLIAILTCLVFNRNLIENYSFEKPLDYPWGTGSYEEDFKAKSRVGGILPTKSNCEGEINIRSGLAPHGIYSLHVSNKTPAKEDSWITLGQKVKVLIPWNKYRIKFAVKANKAKKQSVVIDYKRDWSDSVVIDEGNYDWRYFTKTVRLDYNKEIDFRITSKDEGEIWIDDISFRRVLW